MFTGATGVDRGAKREGRVLRDIIKTKPEHVNSKSGTSGDKVPLLTNYYKLTNKPNWQLYQYRVDFSSDALSDGKKKWLIKEQKKSFRGYLFDGTMLFLTFKLQNAVTEFMSKDKEGNVIQTKIKYIKLLSMTSAQSLQVLNLIQRKSMKALDLRLVGRNFFDQNSAVRFFMVNITQLNDKFMFLKISANPWTISTRTMAWIHYVYTSA